MESTFEDKLRAAVSAGGRALLIEAAFLTAAWLLYLAMVQSHASAWLALWGPNVSWALATRISLWAIAIYKVALWLQAGLLLWAWMWSRALGKRRALVTRFEERAAPRGIAGAAPAR